METRTTTGASAARAAFLRTVAAWTKAGFTPEQVATMTKRPLSAIDDALIELDEMGEGASDGTMGA